MSVEAPLEFQRVTARRKARNQKGNVPGHASYLFHGGRVARSSPEFAIVLTETALHVIGHANVRVLTIVQAVDNISVGRLGVASWALFYKRRTAFQLLALAGFIPSSLLFLLGKRAGHSHARIDHYEHRTKF
jgi:hypothetical protein